jgi:hypothetical protein
MEQQCRDDRRPVVSTPKRSGRAGVAQISIDGQEQNRRGILAVTQQLSPTLGRL